MSKYSTLGGRVALALLTVTFAGAGLAKLAGVEALHLSFAQLGLPGWFGYMIGLAEVLGAVGLWLGRLRFYAAAGLAAIMVGALGYHLSFDPLAAALPALILGLGCGIVAWRNRPTRTENAVPA